MLDSKVKFSPDQIIRLIDLEMKKSVIASKILGNVPIYSVEQYEKDSEETKNPDVKYFATSIIRLISLELKGSERASKILENLFRERVKPTVPQSMACTILKKIMDMNIAVEHLNFLHAPKMETCLMEMKDFMLSGKLIDQDLYSKVKKQVESFGVSIEKRSLEIVIAQNDQQLMEELKLNKGYHKELEKHENVLKKSLGFRMDGKTRRVTVIGGVLNGTP